MSWGNPLAWLGALLVALPVVIHLLGKREPRAQRFPTLLFLTPTSIPPTRRARIDDRWLLAVRAGIVLAAVAALAQPLLLTAARSGALASQVARAVVIDTSASMLRPTSDGSGSPASARAREIAAALPGDAERSVVLPTADVAAGVRGAVAWLVTQPGRRELVVIGDFQVGAVDATDLAAVPAGIGIRLEQIPVRPDSSMAGGVRGVRLTASSTTTTAWWDDIATTGAREWPRILAGPADAPRVEAMRAAARALIRMGAGTEPPLPVVLVHPSHPDHARLLRELRPVDEAWMAHTVARLRSDALLEALPTTAGDSLAVPRGAVTVVRAADGQPRAIAGRDSVDGANTLVILTAFEPGTITGARMLAAVMRAATPLVAFAELEPRILDSVTVARLQRPAEAGRGDTTASDGRWLWLLALLLLGLETWMRRR